MRKSILLVVLFSFTIAVFSQKKDKVLLTINNEKIKVSEFKRVYEKNLNVIDNEEAKKVKNNLELFINYKLKVKEAYDLELDTLKSYIREINTYKDQLSAPYLVDKELIDKMVEDAYFRTKNEIKAQHILVKTPKKASPKDTLTAYNKVLKARNKIVSGTPFETVAKEVSEDPSAKVNGGNLGYFSAFRMVYSFENAAYTTKVGEISMPFKTRFGYHIVKVNDMRASKGEIEAAHILVADTTQVGKTKIDKAYNKLQNNETFEVVAKQYSDDPRSKNEGGKLGKFGSGRMVK
ncbi:MAG: peptidylprolyl isomerase, partial [Polaribacter sp.]